MVNEPHATQSDHASQEHARQGPDENDNKGSESRKNSLGGTPKFHGGLVEDDDDGDADEGKTKLLPQRPIRPWGRHKFANLFNRPGPDNFDEMKDRSHPLLEKLEYLI